MTLFDKLESVLRSPWFPFSLLLLALSTVFIFGGDRGQFYRSTGLHDWLSAHHLTLAVNISLEHGFQRFERRTIDDDGIIQYRPYNRFPVGGYAIMKLATMPSEESPSARLYAARILMLLFFVAAALIAYLSLCRLVSNRWIALTATLLSFSTYHLLYYNDMTVNEGMIDLFAVMATFHGMIIFVQEGRFCQLLVKTCIALLIGWHVLALLLPFVIIGLASEILRARSTAAASTHSSPLLRGKRTVSTLLRSRYLLLGSVALLFGVSVLTFNFAMEYVALDRETPLTELPSFQSMVARTGGDSEFNAIAAADRAWRPFMEGQFQSIIRMFIPYFLIGGGDADENPTRLFRYRGDGAQSPTWLSDFLGVVLSAACLIGAIFVRPRILFLTLASFGFFWMLPMRNSTAFHDFEAIYYIGLPLVFFTLILLLARKLTNRDGVIAAASVLALLLFAASSFQMSRVGYSAETAPAVREAAQDLLAIREVTTDDLVTVLYIGNPHENFFAWGDSRAMNYYLNSRFIRYRYLPTVEGGFVVMRERVDTDALLTPQNRQFFLYDRAGLEAWYESTYRSVASRQPVAREEFDVYLIDSTVYYLKEPCERADDPGRLFLHVYPIDEDDLPDSRKQYGFESLDFEFVERGLISDGKCLASVELPQYYVVKIRTGRADGEAWSATHVVVGPKLFSAYQSIVSRKPVARSEFDLYVDGSTLHYVKEPCADEDTAARFFLHVVPADPVDLPNNRKQYGFDNLDFDFSDRGLLFDGKCLVSVDLPQYGIARITTGQFNGNSRIWEVEIAPDALE